MCQMRWQLPACLLSFCLRTACQHPMVGTSGVLARLQHTSSCGACNDIAMIDHINSRL